MRVLAIAAHPDDAELGAGGTLVKHRLAGDDVRVLIMGRGVAARRTSETIMDPDLSSQAYAAAAILGTETIVGRFPDNRMDSIDLLDVVKIIEADLLAFHPSIVYTHHGQDRNVDHRVTHDAVLTACRPLPGSSVRRILAFEVPSSTEWGQGFAPNVFVDISGVPLKRKETALEQYLSEMRTFPHPRSFAAVRALATWRGACAGVNAAEAFMLVREVA